MIGEDDIVLHLQPIYFRDGRVGHEVLSRGKSGEGADVIIKEVLENRRKVILW